MIDYQKTIDELKNNGAIGPDDKYAVCFFVPETKNFGIVSTTTTAPTDYIMTANETSVKLLDIDKKTGQYLDSGCVFNKADLVIEKKNKNWVCASKGLFGGRYVTIRADFLGNFSHTYSLPKKPHGFDQSELRGTLYDFVKQIYNSHQEEQKKLYKEKK